MWVSYVSSFWQSNSTQKHVHKTLYENHYRSRSPIFSVYVQPASRWVRVVWKCVVAIATTHRSCSLFSEKKHRGNSAFSPSICLASCLHAWCATISEANSLRRREARWLTEVFHKAIHHLLTTARLTVEREGESGRSDLQTKTRRVIKSSWWRPSTHLNTERSPLQKHCWTKITNSCSWKKNYFLCCLHLKK